MMIKRLCKLMVSLSLAAMLYPSSQANAMSRPCDWLKNEEIANALSAKVTSVEDRKNFVTQKPTGCIYKTDNILKSVSLEAFERPSPDDAQQFFAEITKQAARLPGSAGSGPITPVSGIGDQAANVANVLYVRKGSIVFSITLFPGITQTTTPEGFKKAEVLAGVALSRM